MTDQTNRTDEFDDQPTGMQEDTGTTKGGQSSDQEDTNIGHTSTEEEGEL